MSLLAEDLEFPTSSVEPNVRFAILPKKTAGASFRLLEEKSVAIKQSALHGKTPPVDPLLSVIRKEPDGAAIPGAVEFIGGGGASVTLVVSSWCFGFGRYPEKAISHLFIHKISELSSSILSLSKKFSL